MDDKLNKTSLMIDDNSDNCKIFRRNIKLIRKKQGLSMKALGQLIGMSEQAISQYERGSRTPDIKMLYKISKALGVTQTELLGEPQELKKIKDDELIGELKKRGYTISKIF